MGNKTYQQWCIDTLVRILIERGNCRITHGDQGYKYVLKAIISHYASMYYVGRVVTSNFKKKGGLCSVDPYPILVESNCYRHFSAYVLRSPLFLDYLVPICSLSNMPKVNREQISGFKVKLPPIELQREFVSIADAAEASKAELKKSITSIDAVMKGLING